MSSADSDSDEFYDATEGEDVTSPLRRKTSAQKQKSAVPVRSAYEQQLKLLEKERLEAEERRKKEDEALKAQIQELEGKKQAEEEKERLRLLEEQKKREREREEEERRRQEEEEREKEQQEAELRRQEAEKRRRRLELMRRREEGDDDSDVEESTVIPESTDMTKHELLNPVEEEREPGLANRNVEPDVIASTKTKDRPSELPVAPPATTEQEMMPPPVAPPRRKKKKKVAVTEVKGQLEPLETQHVQQQQQQQQRQVQQQQQQQRQQIQQQQQQQRQQVQRQQHSKQESEKQLDADDPEPPVGLPPETILSNSGSRPISGLLTPTTTIESITKELEHTLDLASLTCGSVVVHHRDTQSIKGDSRADIEAQLAAEASGEKTSKSRGNTPDADKLLSYYNLMQGMSDKGEKLTDEEVLTQVLVKNLDTGETIPLLEAEERLPTCINPLNLHIMRLTSEYVSNSSLEKEAGGGSDGEKERDATAVVQQQIKKKKKKLKKFLGKTARRIKDAAEEAFQHEEDFSDDESLPDRVMKIKAASSNKGPYDFDQLKLAQELSGEHTGAVWTMKFSSCGRLLATAGQDQILRVWVLKDHYKYFDDMRQKYNNESTQQQQQQPMSSPATVPATTAQETTQPEEAPSIAGVDTESVESGATSVDPDEPSVFAKTPFCQYKGHTSDLLDVSWSKNYFILSSSMDKTVRLWHVSRNECLCCFQHIDFVTAIAFHPRDDRYFLSGSLDGKLRLWNIPDKKVALWNEIDGPTKLITAANFIQNGRFAVVGTYDGRCIFYDTEHLKYYSQIHVRSTRGRNAKGRKVTAIESLPHQDKILVTSNDSRIRLYDLRDLSLACKYKGCTNISSQIKASFSHNHRYIICGSEDHCIYIWKKDYDFAKFTSVRRDRNDYWEAIKAHDAVVTVAVCSPNPSLIIKPTAAPLTGVAAKDIPLKISFKDKLDPKTSEASKLERKSSLKRVLNQGEVIVSADFNGTIKVFVNRPQV